MPIDPSGTSQALPELTDAGRRSIEKAAAQAAYQLEQALRIAEPFTTDPQSPLVAALLIAMATNHTTP